MAPLPGVTFIHGDFREAAVLAQLERLLGGTAGRPCLSRYVPQYQWHRQCSDQARAMHLAELALEFADKPFETRGNFLVKVFQGSGFQEFFREMQARHFEKVCTASRRHRAAAVNEVYLLGSG